ALDDGRFDSAYEHYLTRGATRGFDPHAAFSEGWYLDRNPDVAEAVASGRYLSGYQHFLSAGLAEGREPHPLYSESHYRHLNPDVDAEIRAGRITDAYLHLVAQGLAEGRRWKTEDEQARLRAVATRLAEARLDELLATGRVLDFTPPERPLVSVLLVLFNRAELTLGCLESLARVEGLGFEVVVVDNLSTDATPRLLDRLRGATVVSNDENLGFTRGANQAAAAARGELLLFLNNDAEALPGSLPAAVDRLTSTPEAGAVGGRVIGIDGLIEEAGSIVWRDATTGGYGRGEEPTSGSVLYPREVDYSSGVFLLTRRETFERLGGFDPKLAPAYYEETDYCFRLRQAGLRVLYEPRAVVLHHGSASLRGDTELARLLAKNREVFAERHNEALSEALPAGRENLFAAGDRRRFRGRVLLLDDHVPLEVLGGGSPRTREILHALCDLDYFVTFFATNPLPLDVWAALREMPEPNLELVHDVGRPDFTAFWEERRGAYDVLIASRRHNLQCLLDEGFDPEAEGVRLIYDAECVAALRRQAQLAVLGPDAPVESDVALDDEIALARRASAIWAVSSAEAEL
ncbi:MAG: glycosyltransferase family 2 protein, partial [bacterium]|nr:glycosyltransferase family 2 protein [bacterium]